MAQADRRVEYPKETQRALDIGEGMHRIGDQPQEVSLSKLQRTMAVKNWFSSILYVTPSIILFSVFVIYPFVRTIIQSLYLSNNRGELTLFTGLSNYIALLGNPVYQKSFLITCIYTLITVPLTIVISLSLAVLSSGKMKGMGIFRTLFSSTMGISVAAGSVFWNFLFHPTVGLLNVVITTFGGEKLGWLTAPKIALISVAVVSVWMNIGFSYLVLMGGLKNIDSSYYESVEIVGGGFFYRLFKVTIPLLSPSLFFVFITSVIGAFQSFGVIDMLTQGGPMNGTNLLVYGIYKEAFVNYQYGSATAQGVILFLIIFAVSMLQIKITEKWVTYQ